MMASRTNSLDHPLHQFAAVPLSRKTLDEVLAGYHRPNDNVSEWMRTGALEPLRRGLYLIGEPLRQASARLAGWKPNSGAPAGGKGVFWCAYEPKGFCTLDVVR